MVENGTNKCDILFRFKIRMINVLRLRMGRASKKPKLAKFQKNSKFSIFAQVQILSKTLFTQDFFLAKIFFLARIFKLKIQNQFLTKISFFD